MEFSTKELRESYLYIPNFVTEAEEEYLLRKVSFCARIKHKRHYMATMF